MNAHDDLVAALRWALPLAERAIEDHRQTRLTAGHRVGTKRVGLYDSEVAEIEKARTALLEADLRAMSADDPRNELICRLVDLLELALPYVEAEAAAGFNRRQPGVCRLRDDMRAVITAAWSAPR